MSKLISGKEAMIAALNGEDVVFWDSFKWCDFNDKSWIVEELNSSTYKFKLKPKTITVNGFELPAPFAPREDEEYWVVYPEGYVNSRANEGHPADLNRIRQGVYRTQEEAKLVASLLPRILRGEVNESE